MNVSDVLMLTLLYLSQSHVTEAIRSSVIGMLRPQPTSGAIQVDAYGRPVHLAEPGRVWNVSPSSQGGSVAASYGSSADTSASYEPNLHYGTLQLKGGPLLDKSPAVPPAAEIQEATGTPAGVPHAALPAERIAMGSFAPSSMPQASAGRVAPPFTPPASLPSLPMQPLAIASPPIVDSSLGSKAAGARLGNVLGSLRRSGIDSLQLPGFSLPTLNLRLPWSLKQTMKALAAESNAILPSTDAVCDRDYSLRCPVGWKPRGEEECEAPGEYTGGCPHLLRVNNIDSQQRRKMETECKVHWPCLGDRCAKLGGRDYSAECPMSWIYTGKCVAPRSYQGHCEPAQNLSGFTEEQKADFSLACQVEWPCQNEPCERDYTHTCPEHWRFSLSSKTCEPPESYTGSFRDAGEIRAMRPVDRQLLATQWGLKWPCASESHGASCLRDYTGTPCPSGWVNVMLSGLCKAPEGYVGSNECPATRHFDFLTADEKLDLELKCSLRWPCLGRAPQDCTKCPKEWKRVRVPKKSGWCEPGPGYTGLCHSAQNWDAMSPGQKEMLKRACNVDCPSADTWNAEASPLSEATAARLLEGTAAGRYHTLE